MNNWQKNAYLNMKYEEREKLEEKLNSINASS